MRRLLTACVAALALCWGGAAGAQVTLTPDALRAAAQAALRDGDLPTADAFSTALLARDPADPVALGLRAQLALNAGEIAAARAAALTLWRTSDDPATRHDAARLIAWIDVQTGHPLVAQLWLRRAMTVAPSRDDLRQTVADFRAVRADSPLSLSFGLAVSPSANATGGTDVAVIEVNGAPVCLNILGECLPLAPAAIDRAWSGVSVAPSLGLTWRAAQTDRAATDLWLRLQGRGVILSDTARAALAAAEYEGEPITSRDFMQVQLLAGIDHRRAAPNGGHQFSAHIGRTWPRGEPGEDMVNLGYTRSLALGREQALVLGGNLEWRFDIDDPDRDQWRQILRAGSVREVFGSWQLRYDLTLTRSQSDHYGNDFDRVATASALTPDSLIPGVDVTFRWSAMATFFESYEFLEPVPGGRLDRQMALGVDLTLDRLSWAGFSPTVSVEAQRTDSNVNQFESAGVAVNFGLESTF